MTWVHIAWFISMALVLPLMMDKAKVRTWLALLVACAAAWIARTAEAYLLIDLLGGAIILIRPAGWAQRSIGMLFAAMALFDIGFIAGGSHGVSLYALFLNLLGWIQLGILASWGAHDNFERHLVRRGNRRGIPAR